MTPTMLNANFDTTANAAHDVLKTPGVARVVMIPIGMGAEPAQGDPVYCGAFLQNGYTATEEGGGMTVSIPFGGWHVAYQGNYDIPWGWMLHAKGAETAGNTAVGIDDNSAASAVGGFLVYQVFAGDGTATIKVQDAATNANGSFADLTGATSGVIDCSTPSAGLVAIGHTATVRRYLRWQIVLGTATTLTFALAFVRATH